MGDSPVDLVRAKRPVKELKNSTNKSKLRLDVFIPPLLLLFALAAIAANLIQNQSDRAREQLRAGRVKYDFYATPTPRPAGPRSSLTPPLGPPLRRLGQSPPRQTIAPPVQIGLDGVCDWSDLSQCAFPTPVGRVNCQRLYPLAGGSVKMGALWECSPLAGGGSP